MRNLIKKSLAFLLVAALALTCFVGTLTVSAADAYNANISVTANPVTLGDTEATAIINVAMVEENVGINEALIKVTSTIGAVAKEVELVKDAAGTAYSEEELTALDYVVDYVGNDISDYGLFYLSAKTATYAIPAAFIKVTFTVGADIAAGTYAINIDVPESKVIAATPDEVAVNFIYDNENPVCFTVEDKVVEPDCEHANKDFYYDDEHEIIAAQGYLQGTSTSVETEKGKIWFKCNDCGEIIGEDVSYYYFYTTGTQNAALESEILYNFKAQPKHLNMQGAFQDAYFVLDMEKETGLVRKVTNYVDADYEDGSKPYYVVNMGVAAKEMTTAMVSTVFVKYNDQWWSGYQFNKKFVDYATERFNASNSTDKEKAMFADMLTYGAAAQNYYSFNLTDLATDYLGEFSSYVTTEAPVIEDKTVNGLLTGLDHVGYNAYSLELGSIVTIKLTFRTDMYKDYANLGELSAVCTYIDNAGNPQSKTYTSAEYKPVAGKNNRWEFSYDGIAAKDMRKIVTCTVNDENGQVGYSLETSIESVACLLKAQTSNANLKATIDAMIKYGDSANKYFAK